MSGLAFCCVYSGFGLFLGPIAVLLFFYEGVVGRKRWQSVAGAFLCLAGLASFFAGYQFIPANECFRFPDPQPWRYFPFFGLMVGRALGGYKTLTPGMLLMVPVTLGLFVCPWKSLHAHRFRISCMEKVSTVLVFFTLLFLTNATLGRVCMGWGAAKASRYVPYVVPGLFGLFLFSQAFTVKWAKRVTAVAIFAYLLIELLPRPTDANNMRWYRQGKLRWIGCYQAHPDPLFCNAEAEFVAHPDPKWSGLVEKLAQMKRLGVGFYYGSGASD